MRWASHSSNVHYCPKFLILVFTEIFPIDLNARLVTSVTFPDETPACWTVFVTEAPAICASTIIPLSKSLTSFLAILMQNLNQHGLLSSFMPYRILLDINYLIVVCCTPVWKDLHSLCISVVFFVICLYYSSDVEGLKYAKPSHLLQRKVHSTPSALSSSATAMARQLVLQESCLICTNTHAVRLSSSLTNPHTAVTNIWQQASRNKSEQLHNTERYSLHAWHWQIHRHTVLSFTSGRD